jgi:glycosyltransferase involved in cell wall biosynthesis
LPNALLEAGAAGRAIVATDAGGTHEIVIDGRTGLLIPVEDVGALTEALRTVASDVTLRDRLGGAARDHVEAVFGMDRFVKEFATLYESLAAARGMRAGSAAAVRG